MCPFYCDQHLLTDVVGGRTHFHTDVKINLTEKMIRAALSKMPHGHPMMGTLVANTRRNIINGAGAAAMVSVATLDLYVARHGGYQACGMSDSVVRQLKFDAHRAAFTECFDTAVDFLRHGFGHDALESLNQLDKITLTAAAYLETPVSSSDAEKRTAVYAAFHMPIQVITTFQDNAPKVAAKQSFTVAAEAVSEGFDAAALKYLQQLAQLAGSRGYEALDLNTKDVDDLRARASGLAQKGRAPD